MEFVNQALAADYERWVARLDPRGSSNQHALSASEVLKAHYAIADYFIRPDAGIGGIGPRDENLLHSAVSRQHVAFGTVEKWPKSIEKAATLLFGIVKDHPF